jgi:hypothetical protein
VAVRVAGSQRISRALSGPEEVWGRIEWYLLDLDRRYRMSSSAASAALDVAIEYAAKDSPCRRSGATRASPLRRPISFTRVGTWLCGLADGAVDMAGVL